MEPDIDPESRFLPTPPLFDAPIRGVPVGIFVWRYDYSFWQNPRTWQTDTSGWIRKKAGGWPSAEGSRCRRRQWVWGVEGGVPLPTGEGQSPLPRKFYSFWSGNGEFWCILGGFYLLMSLFTWLPENTSHNVVVTWRLFFLFCYIIWRFSLKRIVFSQLSTKCESDGVSYRVKSAALRPYIPCISFPIKIHGLRL